MPTNLLKTVYTDFTDTEFAQYISEVRNTTIPSVEEAIVKYGVSSIALALAPFIISGVKGNTGKIFSLINSVYWGTQEIQQAIQADITTTKLQTYLKRMLPGDSILMTTKYYEYATASGNSYTQWTETTYQIG